MQRHSGEWSLRRGGAQARVSGPRQWLMNQLHSPAFLLLFYPSFYTTSADLSSASFMLYLLSLTPSIITPPHLFTILCSPTSPSSSSSSHVAVTVIPLHLCCFSLSLFSDLVPGVSPLWASLGLRGSDSVHLEKNSGELKPSVKYKVNGFNDHSERLLHSN